MEPDSSLDLIIEDLPGIGRRYEMTGTNGGRIIVIITHSGRRTVHGLNPGADQASAVELTDRQARKLGADPGRGVLQARGGGGTRGGVRQPAHRLGDPRGSLPRRR
jgi:hypothetical protein